ncbi:MAG: hypothetical protein FWF67_08415 [Fibromonadales bacterium]|nr:hypothetical protein [Fibromonadales bacterium]
MSKLYVFAIGGSGAKVVESLTMLLAAGMRIGSYDELIPVLIDPDIKNGNLDRTNDLLKNYEKIMDKIDCTSNFFRTKVRPLIESNVEKYKYALEGLDVSFKNFIAYDSLDNLGLSSGDKIKKLANLLFSEKNDYLLNLEMKVGFKGYPNIGSVAFNRFAKSDAFRGIFQNNVNLGDAAIFIGSIFGGTGAAGVPALLSNIRKDPPAAKKGVLSSMPIGVVSLLPYYSIMDADGNKIKSSHFFPKTKSALHYYNDSLYGQAGNNNLQSFYYIANDCYTGALPYSDGSETQKNPVFFSELIAALAVLDFANDNHEAGVLKAKEFCEIRRQDDDKNKMGADGNPVRGENGLFTKEKNHTNEDITFSEHSNLHSKTISKIAEPLFQLLLLKKYMDCEFINAKEDVQAWTELWNKEAGDAVNLKYEGDFKSFLDRFENYLKELGSYGHKFKPFDLDKKDDDLKRDNGLRGIVKKVEKIEKTKASDEHQEVTHKGIDYDFDFEKFSKKLDKLAKGKFFKKRPSYRNPYARLFELMFNATGEIFKEIPDIAREKGAK